ncbi:MAG: protein-export chaperone SecB [Clostridia bacterium]|nr:protein-export chaperone SecB [Clostridia bacterium]
MSALKMNGYKVTELNFVNKAENGTRLSLQTTYSFNVRYTADSKKCIAQLDVKVGDREKPEVFGVNMTIFGDFDVTDPTVAKEKLHVEAYKALFPFARSVVSNVSVNAGIPPIIIAEMDIEKQSIYRIDANPPGNIQ